MTLSRPVEPIYNRILLKLSGEALMGSQPQGIESGTLKDIGGELREIQDLGIQVAVVSVSSTDLANTS